MGINLERGSRTGQMTVLKTWTNPHPLLPVTRGGWLERDGIRVGDGTDVLAKICRDFPHRPVGSEGEQGLGRYLVEVLRESGLTQLSRDPVHCLTSDWDHAELRIGGPAGEPLEALPMTFTGSTPANGVTAPLLYFDDVSHVDFDAPDLAGTLLLIYGGFGEYTTIRHYRAACRAGVAGVVVIRDREYATCYGLPPQAAACGNVPVVSISHTAGMNLFRGGKTAAYLKVRTRCEETIGHNVVGCLPVAGNRIDDTVFLVSAHIDAKPVRPAAADNATGTAMAVEVLRTLAQAPARGRAVWFAGYTDEEYGFSGSFRFPEDHPDVVDRCRLQLYYDGHGTTVGTNTLWVTGTDDLVEFMRRTGEAIGHRMRIEKCINSLDPVVLFARDLPAVQVARAPQRTWHSLHDSMADVSGGAMRMGIHLYAEALYRLINAPAIPFARQAGDQACASGKAKAARRCPGTLAEARAMVRDSNQSS